MIFNLLIDRLGCFFFKFLHRQVLTDLQQKVTHLQTNINQQQLNIAKPPPGIPNADFAVLNELRDTIRQIKSETNTLLQKSV